MEARRTSAQVVHVCGLEGKGSVSFGFGFGFEGGGSGGGGGGSAFRGLKPLLGMMAGRLVVVILLLIAPRGR